MKKFICLFMSLIVTFCTSIQAFAFSIEAANNSIYKEINQIDLSDIKFSIDEDNTIKAFSVSEEGETSINKLEEKLS